MTETFLGYDPSDPTKKWSEDHLQMFCVMKLRQAGYLVHGDTNGANKAKSVGARCKAMGAQKGWPDLTVIDFNGSGVVHWFELKTWTGIVSPDQKAVHAEMKRYGHRISVIRARTPMDAWNQIREILN